MIETVLQQNDRAIAELTGWDYLILNCLTPVGRSSDVGMTIEEICDLTCMKRKKIENCLRQLSDKHQITTDPQGRWRLSKYTVAA